jgi:hypothetical protein
MTILQNLDPESPRLLSLSFTHILQMDFVKRSEERIVIADCFTASTVLIRSTGDLQKMWVRIRSFKQEMNGRSLFGAWAQGHMSGHPKPNRHQEPA